MKISARCKCFSLFEADDPESLLIKKDGTRDQEGRRYYIEIIFDRWNRDHYWHGDPKRRMPLRTGRKVR